MLDLPSLRLETPRPAGRVDAAVTLSTMARLVASGTAVSDTGSQVP